MAEKRQITFDQLEWLKKNYFEDSWANLAEKFNKEFKKNKTPDAIRLLYGKYKDVDLLHDPENEKSREFSWWTRNSFDISKEFTHKEGKFFVSSLMPIHKIEKDGWEHSYNYVHTEAWRTMLSRQKEVQPLILPMTAHTQLGEKQPSHYDPALTPWRDLFAGEAVFNPNLRAVDMRVNPQQVQPLTGMEKSDLESSILIASPRQNFELIATGNETLPRAMIGTGVMNYPGYQPNRIGNLALRAHKIGGIIVEVKDKLFFHRRVQFDRDGGYYDVDRYYHHQGSHKARVEALIFGDAHFGQDNPELQRLMIELIILLQPRHIIFHDPKDYLSINHYMNLIDKIRRPDWAYSLKTETKLCQQRMDAVKDAAPVDAKIYWVGSNHSNFLFRYLKERRYFNDEINFELAHELQLVLLSGGNPVAHLMNRDYIIHLNESDDLFIKGIQCANHGHLGVNGAKGSRTTVGKSASKLITGHTHTPFEKDEHTGLGMWTNPRHGYNEGASTWMPSAGIIFENGARQQIMPIRKPGTTTKYEWRL